MHINKHDDIDAHKDEKKDEQNGKDEYEDLVKGSFWRIRRT